jgi:hypothetical protein
MLNIAHPFGHLGISPEQAQPHLRTLLKYVEERLPQGVAQLQRLFQFCYAVRAPNAGQKLRLCNLFLDRWSLWQRLTLYRRWQGQNGERLHGSNHACQRSIGWYLKERYRTMCGYKQELSAVNVSRLLVRAGNELTAANANLMTLLA